jgi:signal transduction histidine kinase
MRSITSPAIALMNRLKYPQKFLLISFLFIFPLTIVMVQYFVNVEHDINFGAKERLGLEYNAPLIDLLALVQRHEAIDSAALSGEQNVGDLLAVQNTIETQINEVDRVDTKLGGILQVSDAWSSIKVNWKELLAALPTLTVASSIEQHTALSSQIMALITQVGNNSNLILDPDIDSYYLMNSAINTLPLTTQYFSQLRSYGLAALATNTVSPSDETRLAILAGQAQSALEANQTSYRYAFDYNPLLNTRLTNANTTNGQSLKAFLDILKLVSPQSSASGQSSVSLTPGDYFAQATQAIDSSFALYRQVASALDSLLQKRIDAIVQQRSIVLAIALLALVGTVYVFIGFYLSVKKTIAALDQASKRIISSRSPGDLVLESRDELAQAAIAFNSVAKNLDLARREAEEATRMKDLFLATMSHELRTPLNAMIGFLYLMIYSQQLDEDNLHMAERSLANTQRLLALINNILDLSRIATGGLQIVAGSMSPREIASALYNDLKVLAQEKNLQFDLEIDKTLPESINNDEARISQIVTNLVGNAIKFTQEGTIQLQMRGDGNKLVIQVSDTGEGIPQSKHQLIFDDFFQVDGTSTRKQQGAGLGLAIVKRLVLLMNGSVNVISEIGHGSTFSVELPLNLPDYEPGDRRQQAEHVFTSSMRTASKQVEHVVQG